MIEFDEFNEWVRESEEIQDFFLKYTGQQTFERARKRYRLLCEFYKEVFDKNAIDFMGEKVGSSTPHVPVVRYNDRAKEGSKSRDEGDIASHP